METTWQPPALTITAQLVFECKTSSLSDWRKFSCNSQLVGLHSRSVWPLKLTFWDEELLCSGYDHTTWALVYNRDKEMRFRNLISKTYSCILRCACVVPLVPFLHSFPEFEAWAWSCPCENVLVKLLWSSENYCSFQQREELVFLYSTKRVVWCVVELLSGFAFLHSFQVKLKLDAVQM